MYPVSLSHNKNVFSPHLIGLSFRYCFIDIAFFVGIIPSSRDSSLWHVEVLKLCYKMIEDGTGFVYFVTFINCRILFIDAVQQ